MFGQSKRLRSGQTSYCLNFLIMTYRATHLTRCKTWSVSALLDNQGPSWTTWTLTKKNVFNRVVSRRVRTRKPYICTRHVYCSCSLEYCMCTRSCRVIYLSTNSADHGNCIHSDVMVGTALSISFYYRYALPGLHWSGKENSNWRSNPVRLQHFFSWVPDFRDVFAGPRGWRGVFLRAIICVMSFWLHDSGTCSSLSFLAFLGSNGCKYTEKETKDQSSDK